MRMKQAELTRMLDVYMSKGLDNSGGSHVDKLRETMVGDADPYERSNMLGHMTGSLLVLSPDCSKVLLIDHIGHGKKLAPGGHVDAGESPIDAALRESVEETGLDLGSLSVIEGAAWAEGLIDIDSHAIKASAKKKEGEHRHHDFCYLRQASTMELAKVSDAGVAGCQWLDIQEWVALGDPRSAVLAMKIELALAGLLHCAKSSPPSRGPCA